MTSGEHTKEADLPLMLDGDVIVAPVVGVVARIPNHPENAKNWQEYANLIVTAVNTYPAVAELVKALEMARQELENGFESDGELEAEHSISAKAVVANIDSALTRFREAQAGGGA